MHCFHELSPLHSPMRLHLCLCSGHKLSVPSIMAMIMTSDGYNDQDRDGENADAEDEAGRYHDEDDNLAMRRGRGRSIHVN